MSNGQFELYDNYEGCFLDCESGILNISIIGEIEGHENAGDGTKVTSYNHILPVLVMAASDRRVKGILVIVNTVGGDVASGLAISEMLAGIDRPVVTYVVGDCHSIGVPVAVAAEYSFIAPSATILLHPVRMTGMILGATQTYRQFKTIQDRIVGFISQHSSCSEERITALMTNNTMLTKDLGTLLVGEETVEYGLINSIGTLTDAKNKLLSLFPVCNDDN